jgi:class 3 adenylate cyclase
MAHSQRKRLDQPDETRQMPNGQLDVWNLGDFVIGRATFNPGWRWSVDVKPIVGTEWCEYHHLGLMLEGRMHVQMADGMEMELDAGHLFEIVPGHDAWIVGDEPSIQLDFAGMRTFALPAAGRVERVLTSLVATDIVDSTATAERLGPAAWTTTLAELNTTSQRQVEKYRGRVAKTTGDGVIAMFDGAERAVRAGRALAEAGGELGLAIRVGIHTGEVELIPDDLRGIAVHVVSRVMALAGAGEVLVSGTTRDLVADSDLRFEDRGTHELKGVTGARQVWALVSD